MPDAEHYNVLEKLVYILSVFQRSTKCSWIRPSPSRSLVSKIGRVSDSVRGHPLQIMDAAHKTSDPLDRPDCCACGIRSNTAAPFFISSAIKFNSLTLLIVNPSSQISNPLVNVI